MLKKFLYLIILSLILPFNSCSKRSKGYCIHKSDLVDKGFYGNIESIIESVYYLEGNCEEEKIGELICREVSNFNNQGNLLKWSYINSKENFTENIRYEYDSQGYLIKEVSDDLEENLILYKYDSWGNLVEENCFDSTGELVNKIQYEYHLYGNLIEEFSYDSEGEYISKIRYVYDYQWNLLEKNSNDLKEGKSTKIQYEYDSYGNKIVIYYYSGNECQKFRYLYSVNGDLKEVKGYNSDGQLFIRSECKNDTIGNKIEEKLYRVNEEGDENPFIIIKYDIVYLPENKSENKSDERKFGDIYFCGDIVSITETKFDSRFWREDIGDLIEKTICFFDSVGNLIETRKYDSDEDLEFLTTLRYEDGNLIEARKYDSDEDLESLTTLRYEDGKLVEVREYDSDEDIVKEEKYIYDDGRLLVSSEYDVESERKYKYRYIYDSIGNLVMKDEYLSNDRWIDILSGKYIYVYDAKGNLIMEMECTGGGDVIKESICQYNARGELVKLTNYEPEIEKEEVYDIYKYWYDARGNLVEERWYESERKLYKRYKYQYDARDNLIEECRYNSDGELYRRYKYQYDARGNLIEECRYNSDGELYKRYKYKYDLKDNLVEKVFNSSGMFGIELTREITQYEIIYR